MLIAESNRELLSMVKVPEAQTLSSDQRLPKAHRLRARGEFLAVQREGARVHTKHFVVLLRPSEQQRFGVTVTKRVAGAVGRNRIKRVAREVFRKNRELFPPHCDIVLVARKGADALDYARVQAELFAVAQAMLRACIAKPPGSHSSKSFAQPKDPTS